MHRLCTMLQFNVQHKNITEKGRQKEKELEIGKENVSKREESLCKQKISKGY